MPEPAAPEIAPGMMVTSAVRLVSPLGAGGMGSVWVAEHLTLRSRVVVKFMAESLTRVPTAVERFGREAAAASQVKSPHVVQMLDHGVQNGRPYIVMELLEGHDLAAHLVAHGPLAPARALAILTQLGRALGKAHAMGIVHRDIKPSNIFLLDGDDGEPFVKLLDFGVAKASALALGEATESGAFLGSPLYMSPEQLLGQREIDARADLWSVGVVAFEALTGQRPFVAETVAALALRIHQHPPPRPSALRPDLPPALDAWFARACAKDPGERFASSRELIDGLGQALGLATRPISHGNEEPPRVVIPSTRPAYEPAADLALARTAAQSTTSERKRGVVVGVAALALAGGLAVGVFGNATKPRGSEPTATPSVAPAPTPTPVAADTPLAAPATAPREPVDAGPAVPTAHRPAPLRVAPAQSARHGAPAPSAAKLPAFDDDIK